MINLKHIAFKGYKSFEETAVLEDIGKVNIIIGKNNSGKSSVLDIIQFVFDEYYYPKMIPTEVGVTQILTEDVISQHFSKNVNAVLINNKQINYYEYGSRFINQEFTYLIERQGVANNNGPKRIKNNINLPENFNPDFAESNFRSAANRLYDSLTTPNVRKLSAERNISPEEQLHKKEFDLSSDGKGATSIISNYLNDSTIDESLIEVTLLDAFNEILGEDAHFNAIKVQQIDRTEADPVWEIFLSENGKRYALSKMGSGLKTILLVLINLLITPNYKGHRVFLFEELENNLHPALQRRLFNYIYEYAQKNNVIIFMTTHSHVAINCFFEKESANIYHVEKTNGVSTIKKIKDYISKSKLLDDLDVRASDLLQSNGIIWVEGPSDRIYIKKWLSLIDPDIKENEHFQFAYYGGKLLAHYAAGSNDEKDLLNILLTNRHSAIVMDSDNRSPEDEINETKKRVESEFKQNNSYCWITQGKEIENYLSCEAINSKYSVKLAQVDQYALFPEYIKAQCNNFSAQKVLFAHDLSEYIKAEHLNIRDLKERIEELVVIIKKWNHLT